MKKTKYGWVKSKNKIKTITRYNTKADYGLTDELVLEREKDGLSNTNESKSTKSYAKIFLTNIFTFFNMIWLVIAIALIAVGSYQNLLFLITIVLNTAIAIFQECKSKRTVEKLSMVTEQKVKVLRNGVWTSVESKKIVLDDIIEVKSGDQIVADLLILNGEVGANEALLTGEADSIKKVAGDKLLAGSFLISGKAIAKVDAIGELCYIQKIAQNAKKMKKNNSDLFRDLSRLIKAIGVILIPLGILQFISNYFWIKVPITETITNTCASLIGMIPSGMYLLVSIALAVGVVKLANKKTLVQDIYSIEMLARTNVICLDKTGTITTGKMKVKQVVGDDNTKKILASMLKVQPNQNSTSKAIREYCKNGMRVEVLANFPFSSETKKTTTQFKDLGTYTLGASEFVKATCTKAFQNVIDENQSKGYRVLVLAHSMSAPDKKGKVKGLKTKAVIVIEDQIRDDAKETLAWFKQNGVDIKVISGDNPVSVSNIAKLVGIDGYEKYINLSGMSIEEVESVACKYTIFGRVSPEQKKALVKALKNAGKTVAMTGDGVNDTLALKEADCSIAMAEGSDAARSVSNLVLLNNKFSSLPSVVQEGRQVINNVQSSSSLFLMKTIFTMILSFVCLCSLTLYPFEPIQVFMLEVFVIGIPSFFLSLQPNKSLIKGSFLKNTILKSLPYAIILFFNIIAVIMLNKLGILTSKEFYTLSTLVFTAVGYVCLLKICYPYNKLRLLCCIVSGVLILIACLLIIFKAPTALPSYAILSSLTRIVWICFGLLLSATILCFIAWQKIVNKINENKTKQKTNV